VFAGIVSSLSPSARLDRAGGFANEGRQHAATGVGRQSRWLPGRQVGSRTLRRGVSLSKRESQLGEARESGGSGDTALIAKLT